MIGRRDRGCDGGTKRKDGGMTWAEGGRKAKADLLPHPPHPRPPGPNWMRSGHLATLWRNYQLYCPHIHQSAALKYSTANHQRDSEREEVRVKETEGMKESEE